MPLIDGFRSTSVWKAFILNSISSTLVIFIAMYVKQRYDNITYIKKNEQITHTTNLKSVLITLSVTFISFMLAYTIMHFIFGYGGGMLVSK